jgi:hypothetical protein
MEATKSLKYPYLITRDTSPSRVVFGSIQIFAIGRMPGDRTLLSLDASLAIPTRVLRFEDSGLRRHTPVRPVLLTGQTGTHLSDRSGAAAAPSSVPVLVLWINQGTQWFSGEPLETPRTRCSLRQSPLMTRLPRSPGSTLVLRLNKPSMTSSCCSCHHAART